MENWTGYGYCLESGGENKGAPCETEFPAGFENRIRGFQSLTHYRFDPKCPIRPAVGFEDRLPDGRQEIFPTFRSPGGSSRNVYAYELPERLCGYKHRVGLHILKLPFPALCLPITDGPVCLVGMETVVQDFPGRSGGVFRTDYLPYGIDFADRFFFFHVVLIVERVWDYPLQERPKCSVGSLSSVIVIPSRDEVDVFRGFHHEPVMFSFLEYGGELLRVFLGDRPEILGDMVGIRRAVPFPFLLSIGNAVEIPAVAHFLPTHPFLRSVRLHAYREFVFLEIEFFRSRFLVSGEEVVSAVRFLDLPQGFSVEGV